MRKHVLSLFCIVGCASTEPPPEPMVLSLQSPTVAPGGEIESLCQSWTLGNEEPLYVKSAALDSDKGFHHGNWFYVPDTDFAGPDGVWPCSERSFDTVAGTLAGGIFMAQTTQSAHDVADYAAGAAVYIPAHSRIIADVHVLNASDIAIGPTMNLTLGFSNAGSVSHPLHVLGFIYQALELPPRSASEFSMACHINDFYVSKTGHSADFSAYFVLPHYHRLGTFARAELIGGPNDGKVVFETDKKIGEPASQSFEQPVSLAGATDIRITCGYNNTTDKTVEWGFGNGEMCAIGFMTDSPFRMGGVALTTDATQVVNGVSKSSGPCVFLGL